MTGDIMDSTATIESSGLKEFCNEIVKIAPVYAVRGNHEERSGKSREWKKIIEESGMYFIENKIETFEKNGKTIAILGVAPDGEFSKYNYVDYEKYLDLPKVLLSHRPEKFKSYFKGTENEVVDLVFSGHAHGGQVRIPFLNKGLIAPNQGLLPSLISGEYFYEDKAMIVSRGLGNSIPLPRIKNNVHMPIIILE
ncbi:MAG: metallophosphoesterase [Clostridium sp.]